MRNRTDENHRAYTRCRNFVRNETRKIKSNYERNIAKDAKKNPKKFWQYVKNKTNVKQQLPDLNVGEIKIKRKLMP